ncbi:hypothetical protein LDG_7542 [Legionella drancourtii LLAP12]|uniref:Uncharacterized protein n=1 Tax=Legionella drancourtii LLAP12 TaxID=658187 RepID=G9EQJ5_9GAMM|nr:hypothetical protein LDG_7542 [Legionella drancourtii LLAP12]
MCSDAHLLDVCSDSVLKNQSILAQSGEQLLIVYPIKNIETVMFKTEPKGSL